MAQTKGDVQLRFSFDRMLVQRNFTLHVATADPSWVYAVSYAGGKSSFAKPLKDSDVLYVSCFSASIDALGQVSLLLDCATHG